MANVHVDGGIGLGGALLLVFLVAVLFDLGPFRDDEVTLYTLECASRMQGGRPICSEEFKPAGIYTFRPISASQTILVKLQKDGDSLFYKMDDCAIFDPENWYCKFDSSYKAVGGDVRIVDSDDEMHRYGRLKRSATALNYYWKQLSRNELGQ